MPSNRLQRMEDPLRILQVSTLEFGGGAEESARRMQDAYRKRGHSSWLAVGKKESTDQDVFVIANDSRWYRWCMRAVVSLRQKNGRIKGAYRASRVLDVLSQPLRCFRRELGREEFGFRGTRRLLELTPGRPDIVHCHNLHGHVLQQGGYFDLRYLPALGRQVPTILNLHDAWLLSGHCAHSFACERWKTGCGECPDLTIYPSVERDATAWNWKRKRAIYDKSRICITTPSQWLMRKVEQSILAPAIMDARVIPNGVDLSVFRPADSALARAELHIPQNTRVLLFAARGIRENPWKDFETLRKAIASLSERLPDVELLLLAIGEEGEDEQVGRATIRFIGHISEPETVARYYQAADAYVYATRADTFPSTVLESLACGTPAVATAVGGIPEQIEDGKTGFLVAERDAEAMAGRLLELLSRDELRLQQGRRAAEDARARFSMDKQADAFLDWYREILQDAHAGRP